MATITPIILSATLLAEIIHKICFSYLNIFPLAKCILCAGSLATHVMTLYCKGYIVVTLYFVKFLTLHTVHVQHVT